MKNSIFALLFVVSVVLAGYGFNAQSGLVVFEGNGLEFSATSGHLDGKSDDGSLQSTKDAGALQSTKDAGLLQSDKEGLLAKCDAL